MDSIIKINAEREGEKTVLKESFHNAPYKLTHYGSPRLQDHLEMIIMSASPGIMEKDTLALEVNVKKDAQLKLFTQSFNKLHPMKHAATQNTQVTLAEESIFQYVPHPIIPFKNSIFKTVNEVHLHPTATLIWGDIISAGRIHMDEAFEFEKVHSITRLYQDKKLVFADNQCLLPKQQPIKELLFFEEYTHQATFIYSGPFALQMKIEMDEILNGAYDDITFGFTQCSGNTLLLRALGRDGEVLFNFLSLLGQMCWEFTEDQQKNKAPKAAKVTETKPASTVKASAKKKTSTQKTAVKTAEVPKPKKTTAK